MGSINPYIELILNLMRENKWESVAVLYEQQTAVYSNGYNLLLEKLPIIYPGGKVSFSAPVSNDILPLSSVANTHSRIVIVLTSGTIAEKIVCLIQKRYHTLSFPAYQFIFFGDYTSFQTSVSFTLNRHH